MTDSLDQLAEIEVPPPPQQLAQQVHQRLNRSLIALHFFDLFVRAVPWAALRFLSPFGAFFKYTFTGRYTNGRSRRY